MLQFTAFKCTSVSQSLAFRVLCCFGVCVGLENLGCRANFVRFDSHPDVCLSDRKNWEMNFPHHQRLHGL